MNSGMLNSISSLQFATMGEKLAPFGLEDLSSPTGPRPIRQKLGGDEGAVSEAFWQVAQQINRRVELLVALPFEKLDALRLDAETKAIGQ
jgi:hypothetical protein